MTLKQKAATGLVWSFIDNFSKYGFQLIIGIILARLLTPSDFGLIAMITIFTSLSQALIDSGFSQALIQKKVCSSKDYSTVFYFNFFISTLLTAILFFCSPLIADFLNTPNLESIIKMLSIILIIDSLVIVQRTQLTKKINFKLQAKVSMIGNICSGLGAVLLAKNGYGVWSLVFKQIIYSTINTCLIWYWNKWWPKLIFSKKSLSNLFNFGSKLLYSRIISIVFENIHLLVIGKYFSVSQLGFFNQADRIKKLPSQNISSTIQRVTFPILVEIKDDLEILKLNYIKILRSVMFVTFILMLGLGAVSNSLIIALLGEKWAESIIYLQLLVFIGMLYPIHSLNLNLLKVQAASDKFLKLEVIKRILTIPIIFIGIYGGIKLMIIAMIIKSYIVFFFNSYWSGSYIEYSSFNQLKDIFPSFVIAFLMSIVVYFIGTLLSFQPIINLFIQIIVGFTFIITLSKILNLREYYYIKSVINSYLSKNEK